MPVRNWGIVIAIGALFVGGCKTVSPPQQQLKNTSRSFTTVVVDAGHGGRDSGAYRRYGPPEKAVTLDVATRLSRKGISAEMNAASSRWRTIWGKASAMLALASRHMKATSNRQRYGLIRGINLPSGRGDDTMVILTALVSQTGVANRRTTGDPARLSIPSRSSVSFTEG